VNAERPDYTFGVSQFTTKPWTFERDLERFPAHGVGAIEICEFKLGTVEYGQILGKIGSSGLTVSSVQTTIHALFPDSLTPSPADPAVRLRNIVESFKKIAPYVPKGTPFNIITGAAPGGDCAQVYEWALKALPHLAGAAASLGMRVAYEPLNPVLFNSDTALWGLDNALDLVQRIDHPSLGLTCDTWNVFETPNVYDVIRAAGDRIFLVQVSDWRRPHSNADRRCLGEGTIDTAAFLSAVRQAGYRRPYVLEIFSSESLPDTLWNAGTLDETLAANVAAFDRMWKASHG
jgi:sugar phosphate isomerase/epimerase